MATKTEGIRLHKMEVSNFLKIEHATVDAQGRHVLCTGPNGSGKTSLQSALWVGISGLSKRDFPEPVHGQTDEAKIRLDLGTYVVRRRISPDGAMTLTITDAEGKKVPQPQRWLDSLRAKIFVDPVAFLALRPQDQVDQVLNLAGVSPPVDRVQEIAGEALPPRPGESADAYLLRLGADETGVYYVRRREVGRTVDQKLAALEEGRGHLQALGGPLTEADGEQSAAELLRRSEELQAQADQRRAVAQQAERSAAEHTRGAAKLKALGEDLQREQRAGRELERQIAELQARIQDAGGRVSALQDRIAKGTAVVEDLAAQAQADTEAVQELPDPAPAMAEVRQRLQDVEQTNRRLGKRRLAAEGLERLAAEAEDARGEHARLELVLGQLRELRAHLLDGCDLGIPGLEVGQGELRLGGVPLRQASREQQTEVALCVAMAQNPELRLIQADDGEHFDKKSRERLFRLADQKGFQVVFTAVSDTEQLQIAFRAKDEPESV